MSEKKDKEETVTTEKIDEKRVRPTVIRRRRRGQVPQPREAKAQSKPSIPEEEANAITTENETSTKKAETVVKPEKKEAKGAAGKAVKKAKPDVRKKKPAKMEVGEVVPTPPAAAEPAPEGKKHKISKEVTVFTPQKPDRRKSQHRKKVYSKEQLYEERGRRKGKVMPPPKRALKKTEVTVAKPSKRVIKVADAISVGDLSQRLGVKASDIIKKLMALGYMATINQLIDIDAATLVADDFGYEVESVAIQEEALLGEEEREEPKDLIFRCPVVTVVGHVDHGKTSLLDAIRKTNVAGGEHGGITQHIGAYHVHLDKGGITFIDTPGHEAFTAMRARGVRVTDIVVLVVAADDGVMPQTVEAINHAKAAEVPIIVAINKIDLPNADPQRVKTELANYGLAPEEWGGDAIFAEISAKKRLNIKELLDLILLQAEMLELKASPSRTGRGVVVEAKLERGRGPVATVLVQDGTLNVGDAVVVGVHWGRVRAMVDDRGKRTNSTGPSMPVEVLGLSGVPDAGETLVVVKDEATAKQIAGIRSQKIHGKEMEKTAKVSLEDLYNKIQEGEIRELGVVIKGDVHGSVEALKDALLKLTTEQIKLNIIHSAVGGITEGDVMLASASNGIIIGFNVRPEPKVNALAEREGVDIRLYNVIYDVVDDIKKAMEGMLAPIMKEILLGRAEVRETFRVSKVGTVAGSYVLNGKILRGAKVRLIRNSTVVYEGKIASLRRVKDDVKEVNSGFECGISIEGYNDVKVGDVIEAYIIEEEAARL